MLIEIQIISLIAISCGAYALYSFLSQLEFTEQKQKRIKALLSGERNDISTEAFSFQVAIKEALSWTVDTFIIQRLSQKSQEELSNDLFLAGRRTKNALREFYAKRICMGAGFALAIALIGNDPLHIILGAFMGFTIPKLELDSIRQDRQKKIKQTFPLSLDMLVICLTGGYNLLNSLSVVISNMNTVTDKGDYLTEEYKILLNELQLGLDQDQAWNNLYHRTQVSEIKEFVSTVLQAEKIGASLAPSLRKLSLFIMDQKIQDLETLAASLGAKMTLPLAICVLPVVIGFVAGPFIYEMLHTQTF